MWKNGCTGWPIKIEWRWLIMWYQWMRYLLGHILWDNVEAKDVPFSASTIPGGQKTPEQSIFQDFALTVIFFHLDG